MSDDVKVFENHYGEPQAVRRSQVASYRPLADRYGLQLEHAAHGVELILTGNGNPLWIHEPFREFHHWVVGADQARRDLPVINKITEQKAVKRK